MQPVVSERGFAPVGHDPRAELRREAEAELARWRHRIPYSLPRLLSVADADGSSPFQSISRWLRANCRGGWSHVAVPGGQGYFCMQDDRAARRFRVEFGVQHAAGCRYG